MEEHPAPCESLVKKTMAKTTQLSGQPTKPADMLVRVTDFGEGLRICFHNGIA
jgi:hypothetical protein